MLLLCFLLKADSNDLQIGLIACIFADKSDKCLHILSLYLSFYFNLVKRKLIRAIIELMKNESKVK